MPPTAASTNEEVGLSAGATIREDPGPATAAAAAAAAAVLVTCIIFSVFARIIRVYILPFCVSVMCRRHSVCTYSVYYVGSYTAAIFSLHCCALHESVAFLGGEMDGREHEHNL